jgi:hypothetical protein
MRFRKLRIAWSVAWGMVAVLPLVLWVRSYSRMDVVDFPDHRMTYPASDWAWITNVTSARGQLAWAGSYLVKKGRSFWTWMTWPIRGGEMDFKDVSGKLLPSVLGFKYVERSPKTAQRPSQYLFVVPYYFPFLLTSSLSLAPWVRYVRYRFTLRTLLIVTTLVAVVLGLIVWLR